MLFTVQKFLIKTWAINYIWKSSVELMVSLLYSQGFANTVSVLFKKSLMPKKQETYHYSLCFHITKKFGGLEFQFAGG